MINLLSAEGLDVIRTAARERTLLAFDFDGTLAPIVERSADAQLGPQTRALLRAAAQLFPCAVISGRAREDLGRRLHQVPALMLAGNHGAEREPDPPPPIVRTRVRAWAAALGDALDEDGIEIEDKGFTLAVHYRRARNPEDVRRRILRLASLLPGARVFGGPAVVNLAPIGAPTKADAIDAFAARFPPAPLLFAGDDETDEDAFRCPLVTYPIRVGRSEDTAARYCLDGQQNIDRLLWALVSERVRASGLGDGWQALDPARKAGAAG